MSEFVNKAVELLNEKMKESGFDGSAKLTVADEGSLVINSDGAVVSEEDADVTLSASAEVFESIFDGSLNPAQAFMTGQLSIDGDMGLAVKLGNVLS